MNKKKNGILIENIQQLNRMQLRAAKNTWIVPGCYRVEAEALARGYKCFKGPQDVGHGIPDEVISVINEVKNHVSGSYVEPVISGMLQRIFKFTWLSRQEQAFGGEIKLSKHSRNYNGHSRIGLGPVMHSFSGGLDFTNNSFYINRHPKRYRKIIFKSDDFLGLSSLLRNFYNSIFGYNKLIYVPIYIKATKSAHSRWLSEYSNQDAIMVAYFHATLSALQNVKTYPSIACFNYGSVQNIGIAMALSRYNIPVRMDSHGCMVDYGVGSVSKIRALLSKNIYNDFPGVTEVCTRSPLQSKDVDSSKKIIINPKVRGFKKNAVMSNIRVGYAPNFLPLSENYHGLVPSCYDVMRASKLLIKEFSLDKKFELHVRVKTHVGKLPGNFDEGLFNIDRGIAPIDLIGLINSVGVNIIDCSAVEYSSYLDNIDVIITSGVTSVVFDALERRIPVLFYTATDDDISPLPLRDLKSIFSAGEDSLQPVYRVSDLKDLRPGLVKLMSCIHAPDFIGLDNEALSNFIWVN